MTTGARSPVNAEQKSRETKPNPNANNRSTQTAHDNKDLNKCV